MLGEAVRRVLRVEALYKVVFSYFRDDRVTEEPLGICEVIVIPEPSEWRTIAENIDWLCAVCGGLYIILDSVMQRHSCFIYLHSKQGKLFWNS